MSKRVLDRSEQEKIEESFLKLQKTEKWIIIVLLFLVFIITLV